VRERDLITSVGHIGLVVFENAKRTDGVPKLKTLTESGEAELAIKNRNGRIKAWFGAKSRGAYCWRWPCVRPPSPN